MRQMKAWRLLVAVLRPSSATVVLALQVLVLQCGCGESADLAFDPSCYRHLCRLSGKCTDVGGGVGQPASDSDCRQALPCKSYGHCTFVEPNQCKAMSTDNCRGSDVCADSGACTLVDGLCQPGSEEDCAQSVRCLVREYCFFENNMCTRKP